MVTLLMNLLSACLRRPASKKLLGGGSDALGQQNGLLWYKDFGQHVNGEFSMAVFQANKLLEDRSQIESGSLSLMDSGPFGSFVGIYDGHGGPEVAQYITNHLFGHIKRLMTEEQSMSVDVIRKAIQATEDGFFSLVSQQWPLNPHIASVGSCCLIGMVCDGAIYVSNLGDSRAVLGRLVKATGEILAMQLSAEHNASLESIRKELQSMHPNDPQIVVQKYNVWRVKGLIQISRSIGDAFLKKAEYNREPLDAKFRLRETFRKPILSAEPSISVQTVHPNDQFIIFASDGLWEQISNQDAVNIVQNNPRKVCQFQVTGRVWVEPGTDPALFGSTRTRPDPLWIRQRHAGSRFGVRQQQRATTMRGELDRGTRVRGTVPMAGHTADMTGELGTVAMGS